VLQLRVNRRPLERLVEPDAIDRAAAADVGTVAPSMPSYRNGAPDTREGAPPEHEA